MSTDVRGLFRAIGLPAFSDEEIRRAERERAAAAALGLSVALFRRTWASAGDPALTVLRGLPRGAGVRTPCAQLQLRLGRQVGAGEQRLTIEDELAEPRPHREPGQTLVVLAADAPLDPEVLRAGWATAHGRARLVLNRFDPSITSQRKLRDGLQYVAPEPLLVVHLDAAIAAAQQLGRAVAELAPHSQAAADLDAVASWLERAWEQEASMDRRGHPDAQQGRRGSTGTGR